jgi:PmbA protein
MEDDKQSHVARLENSVAAALDQARNLGATQAEASASYSTGLSASVRMSEVETLEYQRDQGLGITVYFGHRKGSASTTDLRPGTVASMVEKACSLARHAAEDDANGLADIDRMADELPDLELDFPWNIAPSQAIDIAAECEAAALAVDKRIVNSEGATLSTHEGVRAYANTHGFLASYSDTHHSYSCAVLAGDGDGMERDHEYTVARDPADLAGAAAVGEEAGRRAIARLGARKLDTRKCPVIYPARLARGLVGHFLGAIRGGSIYRKSSFLLDRVGTEIFPGFMTMTEYPHLKKALGSAPFDGEGVATADRVLVAGGRLEGYVLSSYYARKLGLETTGNAGGVHNLLVSDSGCDFDSLVAEMDTGFIVTELMGQGVNGVTGDYSRGAAGYWVENGEIAYPVSEVTLAGNLLDIFKGITAVASDIDVRGSIRVGSMLIDEITLAGN